MPAGLWFIPVFSSQEPIGVLGELQCHPRARLVFPLMFVGTPGHSKGCAPHHDGPSWCPSWPGALPLIRSGFGLHAVPSLAWPVLSGFYSVPRTGPGDVSLVFLVPRHPQHRESS